MDTLIFYTLVILNFATTAVVSVLFSFKGSIKNEYNHPLLLLTTIQAFLFAYRLVYVFLDIPPEYSNFESVFMCLGFSCTYLYYCSYHCFKSDKIKLLFYSGFITYTTWVVLYFFVNRFTGDAAALAISNKIVVLVARMFHPLLMLYVVYKLNKSVYIKTVTLLSQFVVLSFVLRSLYGENYSFLVDISCVLNLVGVVWLTYMHLFNPKTNISKKEKNHKLWLKLQSYMEIEKPWLNPNLSTDDIADALQLDKETILYLISTLAKGNIHNFLASYRIKEFCLELEKDREQDILELFTKVGFNSHSSAYRQFKRIKNVTPKKYIELL